MLPQKVSSLFCRSRNVGIPVNRNLCDFFVDLPEQLYCQLFLLLVFDYTLPVQDLSAVHGSTAAGIIWTSDLCSFQILFSPRNPGRRFCFRSAASLSQV